MKTRLLLPVVVFAAIAAAAQSGSEVAITAEPHHHLALENEYVRVFQVEVAPHDATLMHSHHHDYVFVTLGPAQIENEVEGKPPETLKLQDGETRFSPGNFAHLIRNVGDTPFRNVTVEFLQDEAARKHPPAKWDEERGLSILMGGSQEIMFVEDGVRVSETDLQPGGMSHSQHYSGPHLLIAITDLDLRDEVEGRGPTAEHFKSGDVKWFPGNYTHALTNTGKQEARFVTLEFH